VTVRVWQRSYDLEVKTRGPSGTDFVQAEYRFPTGELPSFVAPGHQIRLSVEIASKHTYLDWARAYARQGAADLRVYKELRKLREARTIEECHEIHYLQMALEKLARSYLLRHSVGDRSSYLATHVAVDAFVKRYAQSPEGKARFESAAWALRGVKQLAGEIELLTPAVEREARPYNAEYPWSDGMTLTVPADVPFLSRWTFAPDVWAALLDMLDEVAQAVAT
jgi:hypothetical protein